MIDFNWTEPTLLTTLVSLIVYCFFLKKYYAESVSLIGSNSLNKSMLIIGLFLIVFVCVDGDWFHYQEMVWNYDFSVGAINYGEKVYGTIIKYVNRNYMLFRLIVWGLALVLFLLTAKRLGVNVNAALFFLISVFLLKFNYARASLGMACYFYGLSFFISPLRKKMLSFILGLLLMWLSTRFHSSCLVLLPLTIAVFLPINKYSIALVLISLPMLGFVLREYISDFMLSDLMQSNENMLWKVNGYIESEGNTANIGGIIQTIISYTPFYLTLIMDYITIQKNNSVSVVYKRMIKITVCITLFALSFLFLGFESDVFYYRFLFMIFIPLSLITTALYQDGYLGRKKFKMILMFGAASPIYMMLLVLYKTL